MIPRGPLEVSDVTKRTCMLSWKCPEDDGGHPITNYELERMDVNSGQWLPAGKPKGTSFEVKNLQARATRIASFFLVLSLYYYPRLKTGGQDVQVFGSSLQQRRRLS